MPSFWLRCNVFFYIGLVLMNILVLLYLFPNKINNTTNQNQHTVSAKLRQKLSLQEKTFDPDPDPYPSPDLNLDPSQGGDHLLDQIPHRFVAAFSGLKRGNGWLSKSPPIPMPIPMPVPIGKEDRGITRHVFVSGTDTFVHVHMQKTGGSQFGRLLLSLDLPMPCRHLSGRLFEEIRGFGPASFRCRGKKDGVRLVDDYLVSRYSLGWICGVHASFDRLRKCVPQKLKQRKKFWYISNLRNPVERVISEYFHGIEGWADNLHGDSKHWPLPCDFFCNGTKFNGFPGGCARMNRGVEAGVFPLNKVEMDSRRGKTKSKAEANVEAEEKLGMQERRISLFDYLICPASYKNNRQTKMLALNQACIPDNGQVDEENLVQLAIRALLQLDYFGIAERMRESQLLFEYTFGVKFRVKATPLTKQPYRDYLKPAQVSMIETLEHLDMAVYQAAQVIFEERIQECGSYCLLPTSGSQS